jgi:hypothetical protein
MAAARVAQARTAGHYDRHSLIAASGSNAARLAAARAADAERMAREQRARLAQ